MKKTALRFKTLILSDVHLGTGDCKAQELNFLLRHSRFDKLILNGDIIDGWSLKRKLHWQKSHTWFIRRILKIAEKKDTDVIYLRGNHDDFLAGYLPLFFDRLQIVDEHVHHTDHGDYLVLHGDCFDAVTTHSKLIAVLGDIGYQQLLRINRFYNKWRALWGKEYFSISKAIKARVKKAVNHVSNFENHLQQLAQRRGCKGIICGHIHTPENKQIGEVHYLNSGDWVESLSAVVEHLDGQWEVIDYAQFCQRLERAQQPCEVAEEVRRREIEAAADSIAWIGNEGDTL